MSWNGFVGYFSPNEPEGRRHLFITVGAVVFFLALTIVGIVVFDYSNSTSFCSSRCHTMPPEAAAHARSLHARVTCVDCHIGRVGTLRAIQLKLTHGRHLTNLLFDSFERPIYIRTLRPARETCELCHWPEAAYGDRVVQVRHFLPDEANTEKDTYLVMRTGGGVARLGQGRGIHWHIENQVYYITTDALKQDIPWVRAIDAQGNAIDYVDATAKLSQFDIEQAEKNLVDCNDCHNRSAHLFLSPGSALDADLAAGRVDPGIPDIKARLLEVLSADYATTDEGLSAISGLAEYYQVKYPDYFSKNRAAVDAAVSEARDLFVETYWPNLKIGWTSHPNNVGHKDFPGCFRCHDGKHLAQDGSSIRLHCNICHSIPISYLASQPPKTAELGELLLRAQEPQSHLATNFVRDHRFQANESCVPCHGPVAFGSDDKSFCANSSCHGTTWPYVNLDAAFPHPIRLEGAHGKTLCNQCHQGVANPAYVCANCHKSPANHLPGDCAQCHSVAGFKETGQQQVDKAPKVTHALEGRSECLGCHAQALRPIVPKDHDGRANSTCLVCHRPG